MYEANTKYGKFIVSKTQVNYQVMVTVGRHDNAKVPKYLEYFKKLGEYEKMQEGEILHSQMIGENKDKKLPQFTIDDIDINAIEIQRSKDKLDTTEILIRTREPTDDERAFLRLNDRKPITPEIVKEMIENIDKYDKLIEYKKRIQRMVETN